MRKDKDGDNEFIKDLDLAHLPSNADYLSIIESFAITGGSALANTVLGIAPTTDQLAGLTIDSFAVTGGSQLTNSVLGFAPTTDQLCGFTTDGFVVTGGSALANTVLGIAPTTHQLAGLTIDSFAVTGGSQLTNSVLGFAPTTDQLSAIGVFRNQEALSIISAEAFISDLARNAIDLVANTHGYGAIPNPNFDTGPEVGEPISFEIEKILSRISKDLLNRWQGALFALNPR